MLAYIGPFKIVLKQTFPILSFIGLFTIVGMVFGQDDGVEIRVFVLMDPYRWLTCTNKVNNLMGYAVSSEYVKNYFSDAAKQEVRPTNEHNQIFLKRVNRNSSHSIINKFNQSKNGRNYPNKEQRPFFQIIGWIWKILRSCHSFSFTCGHLNGGQ